MQIAPSLRQRLRVLRERLVVERVGSGDAARDLLAQPLHARAVGGQHLATEQVERLDAVGALVDRVQAVVAVELLDRVFAGVAVAAMARGSLEARPCTRSRA